MAMYDANVLVPLTTEGEILSLLSAHCDEAALYGFERNCYVGLAAAMAWADIKSAALQANTRHVAICAQEILIDTAAGIRDWAPPVAQAIQLAGMQCGKIRGKTMSRRIPNVYGIRQDWRALRDDDDVIAAGIAGYTTGPQGYLTMRVVTTHLSDDNPILSEAFAVDRYNNLIRLIRSHFLNKLGDDTATIDVGLFKGQLEERLDKAVKDGDCKAWRNASVTDLGDGLVLGVEAAVGESLNFILVRPTITRIPSVA